MKKIYLLLFTILMTATSFGQDLIITSAFDGPLPGGFPKGIEIYVLNDIADISVYGLEIAGNGGASSGTPDYNFPADSYTAGDFIYVGRTNTSSDNAAAFLQYYGVTVTYQDNSVSHNGDDVILLYNGTTVVDTWGELGVDGTGTAWDSLDGWAYRNDGQGPNATFTASEWTFSGANATDGCDLADDTGTNAGCASVNPIGTYSPVASVDPSLTITAPSDNAVLASGTTSVDVTISVANFVVANGTGDGHIHWTLGGVSQPMKYDTNAETITVADGQSYVVYMELVDNTHTPIVPAVNQTVNFSVAFPCDLVIGTVNSTCDTQTAGVDTYTTTVDFTGGGTSTYTIDTGGVGTVGGDDPSAMASGTITITNVAEGTNFTITSTGDAANSSCNITRSISSPVCVPTTCAAPGSIIVTEIMKNPANVTDSNGEYFEVYNTTGSAIDMQGWTIYDAGGQTLTISSSVVVAANDYAVFGINSDFAANGGITVDYQYSGFNLSNSAGGDEVIIACSGTDIDAVFYDGTNFPNTSGVSMELSINHLNAIDNDNGAAWCDATTPFGTGSDMGTAGIVNTCNSTLSIGRNEITGFSVYPNPITDGYVTIRSANQIEKSVQIYDVLGKQVINATVTNNERINVSNLNAGIYILKVKEDGKIATRKLIIQ